MLLDLNQRNAPTAPDDDEQLNRKQRHDSPPRLLAPPIPDLRFEEGVMVSIQPYLHPLDSTVEIPDEGILPRLIQKGVRIDWMQVTLILVRDQVSSRFLSVALSLVYRRLILGMCVVTGDIPISARGALGSIGNVGELVLSVSSIEAQHPTCCTASTGVSSDEFDGETGIELMSGVDDDYFITR